MSGLLSRIAARRLAELPDQESLAACAGSFAIECGGDAQPVIVHLADGLPKRVTLCRACREALAATFRVEAAPVVPVWRQRGSFRRWTETGRAA